VRKMDWVEERFTPHPSLTLRCLCAVTPIPLSFNWGPFHVLVAIFVQRANSRSDDGPEIKLTAQLANLFEWFPYFIFKWLMPI